MRLAGPSSPTALTARDQQRGLTQPDLAPRGIEWVTTSVSNASRAVSSRSSVVEPQGRSSRGSFPTHVASCGARSARVRLPGGRHVALYLDDEINLEVGVEVDRPFAADGEVVASETPAGLAATAAHFGPYSALHAAHDEIHRWCSRHGHTLSGPRWEIYGHWQDEWNRNPARIRTDVYYLLR